MNNHYKTFKNKITAMVWEELDALFEQYNEMESRSVGDELRLEMIAIDLDTREAEEDGAFENE